VNTPYINFFKNWLYHASQALDERREQLVVMAESNDSVPLLRSISGLHGLQFDVRFDAPENESRFSKSEAGIWSEVVTRRPRQISRLLEEGCSVLYQDVDTAWMEPLFPVLEAAGQHDLLLADDGKEANWDSSSFLYLCTCLMYFHPTDRSKALVRSWQQACESGDYDNDQIAFNIVMMNGMRNNVDFAVLPPQQFPPGALAQQHFKTAVVIHANYLTGIDTKEQFMKDFNLWKVSDQ
jgi:hypothetical protein